MKILLVLFLCLLYPFVLFSQPLNSHKPSEKITFEHIDKDDGLSDNHITCILQDSKGYMWFGTTKGLNKYDGHSFTTYKHDPNNIYSLNQDYITTIFEDKRGTLWIGSREESTKGRVKGGLNMFIREKEHFISFTHDPSDSLSISNNFINSIFEDESGILWIGTMHGLNKFNIQEKKFLPFYLDDQPRKLDTRITSIVKVSKENGNEIWVSTFGDGVKNFDYLKNSFLDFTPNTKHKYYNFQYSSNVIFQDNFGLIWIGTEFGLISFDYKNNKFVRYSHDPNNIYSISSNRIKTIFQDKSDVLWIGTLNGGLNKFNRDSEIFTRYTNDSKNPNSICNDKINSIYQDASGVMWIGTRKGINKFYKNMDPFIHFKHDSDNPNSLSDERILALQEIENNEILISTTIGLNKFDHINEKFIPFRKIYENSFNLNQNRVYSIFKADSNAIWFGSKYGLYKDDKFTGKLNRYIIDPNNLDSDVIYLLYKDKSGTLWMGTKNGLTEFNEKDKIFNRYIHDPSDPYSISKNSVLAIQESKLKGKDILWVSTQLRGINRFDHEKKQFYHYKHDPNDSQSLWHNTVWIIYEDRFGELWCATRAGLNRYNKEEDNFIRYQFDDKLMKNDVCRTIVEDKTGNLWIGNNYGLFRYDRKNDNFISYKNMYGISLDRVDAIVEDDYGNLWLNSDDRITKFNPKLLKAKNYKIKDGINNVRLILHQNLKCSDGKIIFSGLNGFIMFNPLHTKENSYIPIISITDFKLFNKSVEIRKKGIDEDDIFLLDKHISETEIVEIPYDKNVFSLEFAALDFRDPTKNKYAYKLDGIDPDWVYTDASRRFATYNQLNPGEYVFHVKGSNNDGIWNEEGKSLKIIITPLWWQTAIFKIFVIMIIVGIIGWIFYYRINALKKKHQVQEEFSRKLIDSQEMERKRIASALHDSHGQNLLVISNEMQYFTKEHDEYKNELQPVTNIIQESIDEIREISYALHPHQLDKLGLVKTIKSMFNKVSGSTDIKFDLTIDNIDYVFEKKIEINIYRIIQEATNNIIKHSEASEVRIDIKKKLESVEILINDNGKGFDKDEKLRSSTGLGLSGIHERVNLINGKLAIESQEEKGTQIAINIPLK